MDAESLMKEEKQKVISWFMFLTKKDAAQLRQENVHQTKRIYKDGRRSFTNCMSGLYIYHMSD